MKHHGLRDLNVAKEKKRKQGMCQIVALPFTLKNILKQKKKLKYFTLQKYSLKKIPLKETKIFKIL
jgi:hypothetical protein